MSHPKAKDPSVRISRETYDLLVELAEEFVNASTRQIADVLLRLAISELQHRASRGRGVGMEVTHVAA